MTISVTFARPRHGWIRLRVGGLTGTRALWLSELVDPFEDFIAWVEAMYEDDWFVPARWFIDQEGDYATFDFLPSLCAIPARLVITRTDQDVDTSRILSCQSDDAALAFYRAFRRMADAGWPGPDWYVNDSTGLHLTDLRSAVLDAALAAREGA